MLHRAYAYTQILGLDVAHTAVVASAPSTLDNAQPLVTSHPMRLDSEGRRAQKDSQ
jgi:hypothetical protein